MGVVAYLSLIGSGREVGWGGRLFEVGANSRLGAYSNKYGKLFVTITRCLLANQPLLPPCRVLLASFANPPHSPSCHVLLMASLQFIALFA